MNRIAIIRIRGNVGVTKKIEDTLTMLRLKAVSNCVIIDDRDTYKGMLQKIKDYTTWGKINKEEVTSLIAKRGRVLGDKRVDDAYVKENSKYKSIAEFAEAFMKFEAELDDIAGLKLCFRLSPPKKGYKSTKKSVSNGGSLGSRGEKINELLKRMV